MTLMRAVQNFPYGGRRIRIGDTFQVESERHVTLLTFAGRAVVEEPTQIVPEPIYEVAQLSAEAPPAIEPAKRKRGRPRGSYKRRDMRAEE